MTGVCSQANADLVRKLGAAEVIDYKLRDPTRATGFDVISTASRSSPSAHQSRC